LELPAETLPVELILASIVALAIVLLVGRVWGRAGKGVALERAVKLEHELERAESTTQEHLRTIAKMRRERNTVANLAMSLPHVVRALNRDDVDPNDVPQHIFKLAKAIFEPEQILLYSIRSNGPDPRKRTLILTDQDGLREIPEELREIPIGDGKIGWVAEHELDMLPEDWTNLRRTDGISVENNHADLRTDIIGPLLHQARGRQRVFGVMCIERPQSMPRDPKLMLQMVTNFASLALLNAWNMKRHRSAANHDGLTGLLNKRFFLEDIAPARFVTCESKAQPFSIFIFDIDHFKNYNDTNGHPAGDDLLRTMGRLIKESLRPGDLACRYGGEEFVIAMPNTDQQAALELADAVRHRIESEMFAHREKQPSGVVSISGGVALYPRHGTSVTELVKHADEALYVSKEGGRNRVALYRGVEIGETDSPIVPEAGDGTGSTTDERHR